MPSRSEYIKILKPLGNRKFTIGTLYNYIEDVIIHIRLWDREDVSRLVVTEPKKKVTIKIHNMSAEKDVVTDCVTVEHTGPTLLDLGMDEHSTMSFIANIPTVDYEGAWKYVVDRQYSDVVVHCLRSSRKESLDLTKQPEVICHPDKLSSATHVVVAIDYGLEAFCLFSNQHSAVEESTKETLDIARYFADSLSESKHRIETDGSLIIPLDMSCILYSDFMDSKSCWTCKSVAEQYESCRKLLDHPASNAVPIKVWLYPLFRLKPSTVGVAVPEIPQDVSGRVVTNCQLMLDNLQRIGQETQSLVAELEKLSERSQGLMAWKNITQDFETTLVNFLSILRKALYEKTVSIRRNVCGKEEMLEKMVNAVQRNSPFAHRKLNLWIHRQRQLVNFFSKMAQLSEIRFVSDEEQLKSEIKYSADNFSVVVLHLPSNLAEKSQCSINEMNLFANQFYSSDPVYSWDSKMANVTFMKFRQLFNASQKFTDWVTNYNCETVSVRYVIFYDEQIATNEYLRPSVRLYDCGSVNWSHFNIPTAPGLVTITENHRGVVTLTWMDEEAMDNNLSSKKYLIQYRSAELSDWMETSYNNSNENTITINHLQSGGIYVFRVATVTRGGKSPFGPVSEKVMIDPVCLPPVDLKCLSVTDTAMSISWNHSGGYEEDVTIHFYSVECWMDGRQESSTFIQRSTKEKTLLLEPLVSDTEYRLQVRAVCKNNTDSTLYGPASFLQVKTTQPERTALIVRRKSKKILNNCLPALDFYKLPLKKQTDDASGVRRYMFGQPSCLALFGKRRQRTILVLGATGSGKTTLINAMVNYVLGIKMEDEFRFKLIDEQTDKSQAHSQTESITTYDLYHTKGSPLEYSLTVVDTPGFGDTKGVGQDNKIMQQIEDYFKCSSGIRQLEAVCFVIQSSLPRLTKEQKYIFDSLLSIFGKDIKDNIRLMVTFADYGEPPVLGVVLEAGIPLSIDPSNSLPLYHQFNSSFFFKNAPDEMSQMYFEMTVQSFDSFFSDLSRMEAKSLTLTRKVFEERKRLEALIEDLGKKTEEKLNRAYQLEQVEKKLRENKEILKTHDGIKLELEKFSKSIDISGTGQFTTNCQKCLKTCHFPCSQASDENKNKCSVMDPINGCCTICSCLWNVHYNQKYRYEALELPSENMLQREREAANEALKNNEQSYNKILEEMNNCEKEVEDLVNETLRHIKCLNEIALQPRPISYVDYIDLIMDKEKNPQTMTMLRKLREKAVRQDKLFNDLMTK